MNKSYKTLFEAIRAKCQLEGWFGPEQDGPAWNEDVSAGDPHRFGFVFPPASEEQLRITEASLGFPLPALLRALYAHVANGGFGPGGGLRGACGGYGTHGRVYYPNNDETVVSYYLFKSREGIIDLIEYGRQKIGTKMPIDLQLPYGAWPGQVLPIFELGCVQKVCVDSQERIYLVAPIDSNEVYSLSQLPWTFEEWLWRWIQDEN